MLIRIAQSRDIKSFQSPFVFYDGCKPLLLVFIKGGILIPSSSACIFPKTKKKVLGAFICRRSSKTCLTIGCQHVIKCCRSFDDETPSMQNVEKDEEASFVITTQENDNGRRCYPES
jgi:hypothetical protein